MSGFTQYPPSTSAAAPVNAPSQAPSIGQSLAASDYSDDLIKARKTIRRLKEEAQWREEELSDAKKNHREEKLRVAVKDGEITCLKRMQANAQQSPQQSHGTAATWPASVAQVPFAQGDLQKAIDRAEEAEKRAAEAETNAKQCEQKLKDAEARLLSQAKEYIKQQIGGLQQEKADLQGEKDRLQHELDNFIANARVEVQGLLRNQEETIKQAAEQQYGKFMEEARGINQGLQNDRTRLEADLKAEQQKLSNARAHIQQHEASAALPVESGMAPAATHTAMVEQVKKVEMEKAKVEENLAAESIKLNKAQNEVADLKRQVFDAKNDSTSNLHTFAKLLDFKEVSEFTSENIQTRIQFLRKKLVECKKEKAESAAIAAQESKIATTAISVTPAAALPASTPDVTMIPKGVSTDDLPRSVVEAPVVPTTQAQVASATPVPPTAVSNVIPQNRQRQKAKQVDSITLSIPEYNRLTKNDTYCKKVEEHYKGYMAETDAYRLCEEIKLDEKISALHAKNENFQKKEDDNVAVIGQLEKELKDTQERLQQSQTSTGGKFAKGAFQCLMVVAPCAYLIGGFIWQVNENFF